MPPENRNDASAVVDPEGSGPRLFFQRVPEGKQVNVPIVAPVILGLLALAAVPAGRPAPLSASRSPGRSRAALAGGGITVTGAAPGDAVT